METSLVKRVNEIVINDEVTASSASRLLQDVKRFQKEIDSSFKPLIAQAKAAVKAIETEMKEKRAPFDEAELVLKKKLGAYYEMLRIKEAEEKARLEAEEKARLEAERAKTIEALEAEGFSVEAESVKAQVVIPIVNVKKERPEGVTERVTWKAQIVDLKALLKAVIDGVVPEDVVKINDAYLNSAARAFHEMLNIPGVVAVKETSLAVRT